MSPEQTENLEQRQQADDSLLMTEQQEEVRRLFLIAMHGTLEEVDKAHQDYQAWWHSRFAQPRLDTATESRQEV
jgi:hypothetical protein